MPGGPPTRPEMCSDCYAQGRRRGPACGPSGGVVMSSSSSTRPNSIAQLVDSRVVGHVSGCASPSTTVSSMLHPRIGDGTVPPKPTYARCQCVRCSLAAWRHSSGILDCADCQPAQPLKRLADRTAARLHLPPSSGSLHHFRARWGSREERARARGRQYGRALLEYSTVYGARDSSHHRPDETL